MSSIQLQNRSYHVIERTRTSSKCQKRKNARAKRAKILFFIVNYANLWGLCRGCLRWLPTVLTVRTPEEGRRTKSELFPSALGLTSWHSQWRLVTPGISFSLMWVCSRLLPWQQTISKITIFLLFSTYLLPFLELAAVKHLETRQSCENDFGQ